MLAMVGCGKSDPETETTVTMERTNVLRFHVVDHDSDYMRRVVAHADAQPIAGIETEEDVWKVERAPERAGHDYYLEASDSEAGTGRQRLERYFAALAKDPSFAVPRGHELAYEQGPPGKWRSYYLHSPIVLDGSGIEKAKLSTYGDRPLVLLDLTDGARGAFGDLTQRITGGKLAAVSHGEVVTAPVVNDRIMGGMVSITTDAEHEAVRLVKALQPLE